MPVLYAALTYRSQWYVIRQDYKFITNGEVAAYFIYVLDNIRKAGVKEARCVNPLPHRGPRLGQEYVS